MPFFKDSTLRKRFLRHQHREMRAAYRMATFLTLVLMPAFSILDWFTQREQYLELSLIRFPLTLFYLVMYLLARRGIYPFGIYRSVAFLFIVAGAGITGMCLVMDGYRSSYYAGINLVVLAAGMAIPGRFKLAAGVVTAILATYFIAVLVKADFDINEPSLLINNSAFLLATAFVALVFSKMLETLKRQAFVRLIQTREFNAVRSARDMARQALRTRDEFISIASHELKTPITSMKLQNDLLKRQMAKGSSKEDQLQHYLERNDSQLGRLNRLVDDMLDISRISTGRLVISPQKMSLNWVIQEIIDRFNPSLASAQMKVTVDLDPDAEGHWDRLRIEQVLINLVTNAVKYAPGTTLAISTKKVGRDVILKVKDQGRGIPAKDQERIFRRFERVQSTTGATGLGLGLYICRKIVEGHKGTISVASEIGRGSTFTVVLPSDLDFRENEASIRSAEAERI